MGPIVCAARGGEAGRRTQEWAIALAKEQGADPSFLCGFDSRYRAFVLGKIDPRTDPPGAKSWYHYSKKRIGAVQVFRLIVVLERVASHWRPAMDWLTLEELRALVDRGPEISVSLFMPTHRDSTGARQDRIRFKNLLREAAERLRALERI